MQRHIARNICLSVSPVVIVLLANVSGIWKMGLVAFIIKSVHCSCCLSGVACAATPWMNKRCCIRITEILTLFETMAEKLQRAMAGQPGSALHAAQDSVPEAATATEKAWAADFPLLSAIIDVGQVLSK